MDFGTANASETELIKLAPLARYLAFKLPYQDHSSFLVQTQESSRLDGHHTT